MKFELPGILQSLLAGALVFLLPGCGGGNEDQETEAVTPGQENPEEDASLRDFLPGKAVVVVFGERGLFEGSVRFLFAEGGGFTLSQVGRNDRKASGTYRVGGSLVVIRIEDEEAIAVLEFPGGLPAVGGEIQFDVGEDEIAKGRITAIQANAAYGQVPRTPADFRKLPGTPLNEREKQYVGRWAGGDQENQWTTIIREDHTYSYLTEVSYERPEELEELDDGAVPRRPAHGTKIIVHGVWTIANESIYFMDLVSSDPEFVDDESNSPYVMEIVSLEAGKVVCINVIDGAVTEDGEPYKSVERRIEKFEEPEMKPFNAPEALKGFDILKADETPRSIADFRKLLGSPLNEREKQYVGRWEGRDQENQWTTIIREDHTYSYLNRGTEYVAKDGVPVPGKKTRTTGHGIWTIVNDVIYLGDLVWDGKKVSMGDEDWEPYALEIVSLEAGKVVCISIPERTVSEEKNVDISGEPLRAEERRIDKFEEPEMKPFNGPEALKGFDVLKAYEEAKDPEVEEVAPAGE
ncbi:MAG: hypothetical protein MK194_11710 [Roseibacillus sp.]|nr:hypothetical protein [Roseibacillus sp.]